MIQADHPLTVTRRCELLDVARSTVYYHPTGIPSKDLALMRLLDEIHLAGISILPAPDGPFIHPRSAEPTRLFSSHHRPGSEAVTQPALTCRGLEARASKGFLRHRSSLVSSPCQAGVLARAARQPAGTGSAQIRWSIAPNRRRVR